MSDPVQRLAAIVFTDIAGFTALSAQDEKKAFSLISHQRELLQPIVAKFNGQWLKEMGDGLLLCFPSSTLALKCAIEIQHTVKDVTDLNLRIGIHQGEILEGNGDIFGDDVNIASRIEPFSAVGGIAISHKIYGDISGSPEYTAMYVGQPKLKGVRQEVKIYCITSHDLPETNLSSVAAKLDKPNFHVKKWFISTVILALVVGAVLYFVPPDLEVSKNPRLGPKSVAVLPFANWSNLPENEYFSAP